MTIILNIVVAILLFNAGFLVCWFNFKRNCNGTLNMIDDAIWLGIDDKDIDTLMKCDFATLRVNRRNFNGFNGNNKN